MFGLSSQLQLLFFKYFYGCPFLPFVVGLQAHFPGCIYGLLLCLYAMYLAAGVHSVYVRQYRTLASMNIKKIKRTRINIRHLRSYKKKTKTYIAIFLLCIFFKPVLIA